MTNKYSKGYQITIERLQEKETIEVLEINSFFKRLIGKEYHIRISYESKPRDSYENWSVKESHIKDVGEEELEKIVKSQ